MAISGGVKGWRGTQLGALVQKASLSRRRSIGRTHQLAQLFLPLILALPFSAARLFKESEVPAKSGVDRAVHLGDPFATKYAARLCVPGSAHFAVAPSKGLGSEFRAFLVRRFGVRPDGWPEFVSFQNGEEVEGYVRSADYGQGDKVPLCGALTFDSPDGSAYTLRLNGTIVGNRGAVCGGVDTRRVTSGRAIDAAVTAQDWYLCSGFLAFQKLADDFLLERGGSFSERSWRLDFDVLPFPTPSFKRRTALSALRELIGMATTVFFAYAAGQVMGAVVSEREQKLLEAMKLMGLRDSARFAAHALGAMPVFVLYGLEFAAAFSIGVFTRSSFLLLALFLGLAGCASAAAALCCSSLFDSAKLASLVGVVGTFAASRIPLDHVVICLIPPLALVRGLARIVELELDGPGLQQANLWDNFGSATSMAQVVLGLLFSVPLYLLLWAYFEQVVPHQYGSAPQPWYRPWPRNSRVEDLAAGGRSSVTRRRVPAETTGIVEDSLPVACTVEVIGTRKEFVVSGARRSARRVVAVRHLDLGLAEGEILALLGHNGAGKSTTVGMLTGVLQPTKGKITVHGFDVSRQPQEARRFLGVCPQHDVLFSGLTASEHLSFANVLRATSGSPTAAEALLRDVGLRSSVATGVPAGQLSAGRRRALCVALAFVGDPRFIVLDEPTSGMDPFVRRSMWELLKRFRPGRALCLSTHYMDEAEMLGDQVCILSRGSVQCYGSPDCLKVRLGSGYMLTLARAEGSQAATSTETAAQSALELLQRTAPKEIRSELKVTGCVGNEAVIRVPFAASGSFPELLRTLDGQKARLGFASVTVSATTLEELFLRLADGEGEAEAALARNVPLPAASQPLRSPMTVQAASSMEAIMAELASVQQPARAGKVRQASALLLKRWQTLQRSRRALLCLCLLPLIFNILGVASIAASFELDSPPLEILGTAEVLNQKLVRQGKPHLAVPFTALTERGSGREAKRVRRYAEALLAAGAHAELWDELQFLTTNASLRRPTTPRHVTDGFLVDASFVGGKLTPEASDSDLSLSKYEEMRAKGAPEFVIRKVMDKDGVPASIVNSFLSGTMSSQGEGGSRDGSVSGRLTFGLRDRAQVSVDTALRETSVQFSFGQAPLRADIYRPEDQRQELVTCAAGGPLQVALSEEAMQRLESQTRHDLQAMQQGGAPTFAQRAYLKQAGVDSEDVDLLVASASPESVPREHLAQLGRCARWQAFAEALLESRASLEASRYAAFFFEDLDIPARRGRMAVFHNASVFHSAPLFLGLARRAAAAATAPMHEGKSLATPTREVRVTNWPLPLTQLQRDKAFSTQGWSFFSMALLGVAFLPAGLAADAAREVGSGSVRQQAIAGMPPALFVLASFFADMVLVLLPLLSQLVFVHTFQLAVFVDCPEIIVSLLILFAMASTAQVYAMLPKFQSVTGAQSFVLALNVVLGFFLGFAVWILSIPFLGEAANMIARVLSWVGRLSPAFNLSNAMLTIPNTAVMGFSSVHGLPVLDWRVAGAPLAGLVLDIVLYTALALRRSPQLRLPRRHAADAGGDRHQGTPRKSDESSEVAAERKLVEAALRRQAERGLILGSVSVGFQRGEACGSAANSTVSSLSIYVPQGDVLGVLGVSGSGKSALLAALVGALPESGRTTGQAMLDGQELLGIRQLPAGTVGYCPQENELSDGLTVREHVQLFGRLRGLSGRRLASEVTWLCSALDLEAFEESRSENLSGGNQRKLQCACALIGSPRLICLDEPSAGLDPMARRSLCRTLRAKLQTASAAVVATKSIDEAESLCSKLAILSKDGHLITVGTALEIRNRYGGGHELRATLRRPTMPEVYEGIADQRDPEVMSIFLANCVQALGGVVGDARGLMGFAASLSASSEPRLPYGELLQALSQLPWVQGLSDFSPAAEESKEGCLLAEDSAEMKVELANRSRRIVSELRPLFPRMQCVEEVSLMRVFQLHDERPQRGEGRSSTVSATWNVADVFRNVEDRKERLRIADYSITQASLEHVFNQFAIRDQSS